MDNSLLSFETTRRPRQAARATASPVLDLVYACFYLHGSRTEARESLGWAADLRRADPSLADDIADLIGDGERARSLFAMALDLDYAWEEDPRRYLDDLPRLPELLAERHPAPEPADGEQNPKAGSTTQREKAASPDWQHDPPTAEWSKQAASLLERLWQHLAPSWNAAGRRDAEEAADQVDRALEEHGDVLRALPQRHFVQFERIADSLKEAYTSGRLRIVPLAFAESGGFHLKADKVTAVGFGLHGEQTFHAIERQVREAAAGAKAFADPTRLMLLNLITRFKSMPMTVGDLARQVGVTQPTVSGHLRLLREAGLITTEQEGNRTIPKPNTAVIEEKLAALDKVLRD